METGQLYDILRVQGNFSDVTIFSAPSKSSRHLIKAVAQARAPNGEDVKQ